MVAGLGDAEWFTAEWVINALKAQHKVLASYFLGEDPANLWLRQQVNIIRLALDKPGIV